MKHYFYPILLLLFSTSLKAQICCDDGKIVMLHPSVGYTITAEAKKEFSLFPQARLYAFGRRWLNWRDFQRQDFFRARVALANRFLTDHLKAKAMHGVFGDGDFHVFQKQADVVVRRLPVQKSFDLRFERQQQCELARQLGLVAVGKLLEANLAVLGWAAIAHKSSDKNRIIFGRKSDELPTHRR